MLLIKWSGMEKTGTWEASRAASQSPKPSGLLIKKYEGERFTMLRRIHREMPGAERFPACVKLCQGFGICLLWSTRNLWEHTLSDWSWKCTASKGLRRWNCTSVWAFTCCNRSKKRDFAKSAVHRYRRQRCFTSQVRAIKSWQPKRSSSWQFKIILRSCEWSWWPMNSN